MSVLCVPDLRYDKDFIISTGVSATAKSWVPQKYSWGQLLDRIRIPVVTRETMAEYQNLQPKWRTKAKDVGGFVGGKLQGIKRGKDDVVYRTLITLDIDDAEDATVFWFNFSLTFNCAAAIHSTHSHTPEKPKLRLIIPTAQELSPKNYRTVAKYIAGELQIEQFDPTTYEPNRLMFWPSVCKDGQHNYFFDFMDAPFLDCEPILAKIREQELMDVVLNNDPAKIPGPVGIFCKKFSVPEAIERFLSEVYAPFSPDRYRLIGADSTAGMIIYGDGKYCYSHHAKDPAQGKILNAYDLVRIHSFGDDKDSHTQMLAWIKDNKICPVGDWPDKLTLNSKGKPVSTISNMRIILNEDTDIKDSMALDAFANRLMVYGDFPWIGLMDRASFTWSDTDDAGLREFFETKYGLVDKQKLYDALALNAQEHKIHPVKKYLESTVWDGIARADTLFVDFMAAQDTPYVRAVTRKALIGAVARIMQPGVKHDHVLVLVGPQGCRKSTTIQMLGTKWYSDSLYTMQTKDAYELLQGYWLIELSEMAATRKSDIENIKQFISKQSDNYRSAYDRRTLDRPRQCAFFGSTNDAFFLKDPTGNRRFWPVEVNKVSEEQYSKLTPAYVQQVWAEILCAYRSGEAWHLSEKLEQEAVKVQEEHYENSTLDGIVDIFVNSPVPEGWDKLPLQDRLQRYAIGFLDGGGKMVERERVCSLEIWLECLGGTVKDFTVPKSREINNILRSMPDWKQKTLRLGGGYGVQKGFIRRKIDKDGDASEA